MRMPRFVVVLAAVSALSALARPAVAQGTLAPVIGRVLTADAAAAMPRVRITAVVDGRAADPVFTDDQGWFAVDAPSQSRVAFTASKAGFVELRHAVAPSERTRITPIEVRMVRAGAVGGHVTDAAGAVVAMAMVTARRVGGTAARLTATTDDRGEYRFGGLLPGRYEVSLDTEPGSPVRAEVQVGYEVPINLVARGRRPSGGVDPGAGFTGTVIDEFGDPAQGVRVDALRVDVVNGRIQASLMGSARTDDRGWYRITRLAPGRYFARVSTEAIVSGGPRIGDLGFAPIYYPGVVSFGWADPVEVRPGREEGAVDAVFGPSLAVRVTGRALDAAGRPLAGSARLATSREQSYAFDLPAVPVRADGSFVIANVPPGAYVLHVDGPAGPGRPAMSATVDVSVFDRDPPPITVTAAPSPTADARVQPATVRAGR